MIWRTLRVDPILAIFISDAFSLNFGMKIVVDFLD